MNQMPTATRERIFPVDNSKTRRRELRGAVRTKLGTSRDGAPTIRTALRAVVALDEIVRLASAGRFRLEVRDDLRHQTLNPIEAQVLANDAEVID